MQPADNETDERRRRPLVQNSLARLAADGSGVVFGTVSSIVTARVLGPSSKGTLAALTLVTTIVIQASLMGLGDAMVVRVGQAKIAIDKALRSSLSAVILSSAAGALAVLAYSVAQLPVHDRYVWPAVVIACGTVGLSCVGQLLLFVVYARHQMVTASVVTIATAATTTAAIIVLCAVLRLDVLGGALASLVAATVLFTSGALALRREKIAMGFAWDSDYLRPALRFGLRAQGANLLAYSTARLDLLLVYALTSATTAGQYSIALTIGTLSGFVALALSYASFPGMAELPEAEALKQTAKLARVAALVAVPFAAVMALLAAVVVPVLLGAAYKGSIVPGVVLLFGNVVWGQQWLLSRALAARADPNVLFWSFAANLASMTVADLALIPVLGALGAAIGSVVAPTAGLIVCLRAYKKRGVALREFIPGVADLSHFRELAATRFARARPR
ncbi:MAG: lipopolysaccharide biosynthesis protein [Actinobacteria bacterium]|nr:lipopolysaccharide biosynthesis protein [Actinomycetota bacterium]